MSVNYSDMSIFELQTLLKDYETHMSRVGMRN